jgi:hypothetical protein
VVDTLEPVPDNKRASASLTDAQLYGENAKIISVFWEWRHKVMMFFFTGAAGLVALGGWLWQNDLRAFTPAPLFLGILLSTASRYLDRRNVDILVRCFEAARLLEPDHHPSVFKYLLEYHKDYRTSRLRERIRSYTFVLGVTYALGGIAFAAGFVASVVFILRSWVKT